MPKKSRKEKNPKRKFTRSKTQQQNILFLCGILSPAGHWHHESPASVQTYCTGPSLYQPTDNDAASVTRSYHSGSAVTSTNMCTIHILLLTASATNHCGSLFWTLFNTNGQYFANGKRPLKNSFGQCLPFFNG